MFLLRFYTSDYYGICNEDFTMIFENESDITKFLKDCKRKNRFKYNDHYYEDVDIIDLSKIPVFKS